MSSYHLNNSPNTQHSYHSTNSPTNNQPFQSLKSHQPPQTYNTQWSSAPYTSNNTNNCSSPHSSHIPQPVTTNTSTNYQQYHSKSNTSPYHHTSSPPPPAHNLYNNGNPEPLNGDHHSPISNASQAHMNQTNSNIHNSKYNSQYHLNNYSSTPTNSSSSSSPRFSHATNNNSCDNMKCLMKASSLMTKQADPPSSFESYASERKQPCHPYSPQKCHNNASIIDRYVNVYSPPPHTPHAPQVLNSNNMIDKNEQRPHHSWRNKSCTQQYDEQPQYNMINSIGSCASNIPSIQDWFDKHEHQFINNTRNITRRGSITKIDTTVVSSAGSVPTYQSNQSQSNSYYDSFQETSLLTPQRSNKFSNQQPKQKIFKQSKTKSPQTPIMVVNILGNEYSDFINEGTLVKKKKSIKFKYYTPKM